MDLSFAGLSKTEATSLYFAIEDFIVKDRFTRCPVMENIVSVKEGLVQDSHTPIFSAEYDQVSNRKAMLRISALPLQFVLNDSCIQQVFPNFRPVHDVIYH